MSTADTVLQPMKPTLVHTHHDDNENDYETDIRIPTDQSAAMTISTTHHKGPVSVTVTGAESSSSSNFLLACAYIIVSEFCERMAYWGIGASLPLFLSRELQYSTADADFHVNLWQGCCYITPLLGGYIADAWLGRYYTILIFITVYLIGMLLASLTVAVTLPVNSTLFFTSLYIVALGTGGIKPNVSCLGADYLEGNVSMNIPRASQDVIDSYFSYFYLSVNAGAFISFPL
jgi:peptide/histidine transporter 3/4